MKHVPATLVTVYYEPVEGHRQRMGRLASKGRELLFEYSPDFLATGLQVSPFKLPLRPGVFTGDPSKFEGLMGVFDDSLPDGWGRLLIDRRAAKQGLRSAQLTPLDRLCIIGSGAMGALVYEPESIAEPPTIINLREIADEAAAVLAGVDVEKLERLIAVGGSPQGARPKALVQLSGDGRAIFGDRRAREGCTPFVVKFRARDDSPSAGLLEHAYFMMARAAGMKVPATRILGGTAKRPGHLAVERFDREGHSKVHMHSAAGLLHAPHTSPSLNYVDLLVTTRKLTHDEAAVTEMFRRACFNVFAHNRDDHSRNFAFLMNVHGEWSLSPAYDLTYSGGPGGEHATQVASAGRDPTRDDLLELASRVDVNGADEVLDETESAVRRFRRFAEEAGLPKKEMDPVARALGIASSRRK